MTEEPFHAFAFDGVLGLGSMCSVKGWRNDSEKVSNDAIFDIDLQNIWDWHHFCFACESHLTKTHEQSLKSDDVHWSLWPNWVRQYMRITPWNAERQRGRNLSTECCLYSAFCLILGQTCRNGWIVMEPMFFLYTLLGSVRGMESSTARVDSLHQGPHFRISSVHHLIPLPNKSQYITIQNGWVTQDNAICSVMAVMANMYQLLTYLSLGTFKSILDGYRRRPVVHIGRLHFRSLVFKIRRNFVLSKHPSNLYQTDLVF